VHVPGRANWLYHGIGVRVQRGLRGRRGRNVPGVRERQVYFGSGRRLRKSANQRHRAGRTEFPVQRGLRGQRRQPVRGVRERQVQGGAGQALLCDMWKSYNYKHWN